MVTFNDAFNIVQTLDDIKSIGTETTDGTNILAIEPTDGGYEFDKGYNTALEQLQEFLDVQVMAAANNDDDDEKEELIENRIIMITNNLPNADSSLMDLMDLMDLIQVYSDSDENKILNINARKHHVF